MGSKRHCVCHDDSCRSYPLTYFFRSNFMATQLDHRSQPSLKRHIFSADVGVQTDTVRISTSPPPITDEDLFQQSTKTSPTDEDMINQLTAADLASILKWSMEISRDINLSVALQRLTEIVTGKRNNYSIPSHVLIMLLENSGSQGTCVVIAREGGDYTVATSMIPPEPCQVHECVCRRHHKITTDGQPGTLYPFEIYRIL